MIDFARRILDLIEKLELAEHEGRTADELFIQHEIVDLARTWAERESGK